MFSALYISECFSQESLLNKKISISFDNTILKEALISIEKHSGISFAYSDLPELNQKVTAAFTDQKISDILNVFFDNTSLTYKVVGSTISIYSTSEKKTNQTIHGYIYDKNTGEALIGATIYESNTYKGAFSNEFGFFSFTLPSGKYDLNISFLGYSNQKISFTDDTAVMIYMAPETRTIDEVVINAQRDDDFVTSSDMGNVNLATKTIKEIPSLGGEADMLKAITLLPGVKQGTDGTAGIYVRGGGPDQNLILLDGVPLYNTYHLWGYLSTFNADAINNVEVTKGAFPARYGGRLSSVVDVTMNNGNNHEWEKKITFGLMSGRISASGPLKKDTSSLFLSARRTYADLILVPLYASQKKLHNSSTKTGYNFTDLNMKLNYRFSGKNRLYLSTYLSRDKWYNNKTEYADNPFEYQDKQKHNEGWGNAIVALRWNHLFSKKLFVNTTAYYTGYNYYASDNDKVTSDNTEEIPELKNTTKHYSNINDFCLKQDYQFYVTNRQSIRYGAGGIYHLFKPDVTSYYSQTSEATINYKDENNSIRSGELYAYLEDEFELASVLRINAGLNASGFLVQNTAYYSIQPRISGRIMLNRNVSLKAGYSQMTQYLHLLTTSSLVQSSDLWVTATNKINPQLANLYSLGFAWYLMKNFQLEAEAYYKTMDMLIAYREGYESMDPDTPLEDNVTVGRGESYGTELLLRKIHGNPTGWIGYTLSKTDRQFNDLNNGKTFPYKFDRRHDISFVANYRLSQKWDLNLTWLFSSGMRTTVPTLSHLNPYYTGKDIYWTEFITPNDVDAIYYTSGRTNYFETRNNYKLPDYHRLDITATLHKKTKRDNRVELTFGITNVYNRLNPTYYLPMGDESGQDSNIIKYEAVTLFPIMPTFTYNLTF